jgi:biopolymer transport protein ExbB
VIGLFKSFVMGLSIWNACGPVALPLLLVSMSVFAVGIDRATFWWRWWRPAGQGRRQPGQQLKAMARQESWQLDLERLASRMANGEQLLQAAILLAPLLGLTGTVHGLMQVLRDLGPQLLLPPTAPLAGYADVLISTLVGLQLTLLATALLLLNQALSRWQIDQLRQQLP